MNPVPHPNRFCPHCGNELSPDMTFCPKCGVKSGSLLVLHTDGDTITASDVVSTFTTYQKPRKRIRKFPFVLAGVVLIAVAGILIVLVGIPANRYGKAVKLYDNSKYEDAVMIFSKLGAYKDSTMQIGNSLDKLCENGDYQSANDLLDEIWTPDKDERRTTILNGWTESLLIQARYQEAYDLLNNFDIEDDDRSQRERAIIAENAIALCSKVYYPSLKDPSSFELRGVWFVTTTSEDGYDWITKIVLNIGGKNSYGGMVPGYSSFTLASSRDRFEIYASVSGLDDEEIYSWDDYSDILEKILYNTERADMRSIISGVSAPENKMVNIKRINQLFTDDLLPEVLIISAKMSV